MIALGRPRVAARRPAAVAALAASIALLAPLAACSSSASDGATTTTASSTTSAADAPCAWPTKANKDVTNVAYPDTGATYWAFSYRLAPGETLRLRGRFPKARYMSFITYAPTGGALDVLTDRDIQPTSGGTNPFASGGKPGGAYTVTVSAAADAEGPNLVRAIAKSGTTTTTLAGEQPPAPTGRWTPLGSGRADAGGVGGTLIYRVYLSGTADDPTGGGGLPDVSVVAPDGTAKTVATCAEPGANPNVDQLVAEHGPATDKAAPSEPIFIRPAAGVANLYPNPDNIYVATIVHHTPGQVVVLRAKAPTFPDTGAGQPVTGDEQVRYWSLCTNEYRKPYPVSSCVADQDVVLDDQGRYTIVVSTPEDRPANATAADGITWLDWGSTKVDGLLLMRQMLPAPDFAEAASKVAEGSPASTVMGAYTPGGAYCAKDAFEAKGPDACLAG